MRKDLQEFVREAVEPLTGRHKAKQEKQQAEEIEKAADDLRKQNQALEDQLNRN
ncbi:hypothetical protein [Marinobacter sp.]|uniref:hypothetical protein n=1 Tax=Marinobacter sp. TaxID=50741 RepID=UPI003A8E1DD2